jgi:hypothetical protein
MKSEQKRMEGQEEMKQMWVARYSDGARVRIWGVSKSAHDHALALQKYRTHYYKQMIALVSFTTEELETALDDVFFIPVEPLQGLKVAN